MKYSLMILVLIFAPLLFAFEDDIDGFKAYMYRNAMGDTIPYRLFVPHDYNKQKSYPLILWLHGSGGAGPDNIAQISEDQIIRNAYLDAGAGSKDLSSICTRATKSGQLG